MFEGQFLNLEHALERTRFRKIYTMIQWILIVENGVRSTLYNMGN